MNIEQCIGYYAQLSDGLMFVGTNLLQAENYAQEEGNLTLYHWNGTKFNLVGERQ